MTVSLTFHGGAGTVTGSRHELQVGGQHVLIDCGLFQGLKDLRLRNWAPPTFDPRSISIVFLTHAHIDHSGYLPRLVKLGFRGNIVCTKETKELAEILLMDAAKLQVEDAEYANRKGFSKHRPALPLFDDIDARAALARFQTVPFGTWFTAGNIRARFHQAGHILGSAFVEVQAGHAEASQTIVFSGDLGRAEQPLHPDPEPLAACDTLVLEATYGDRSHDHAPLASQLAGPLRRAIKRKGIVLIPAFAVARAQLIALLLRDLVESGEIPNVPIHIDSPMAVDVTEIYASRAGSIHLDPLPDGETVLFPRGVRFHSSIRDSQELNTLGGPRIIISSSGMLTGGRVLHHLERLLPEPKNMILLAGYQAAGTRGRSLQQGAKSLRMHGMDIPVGAEVVDLHGLSAHADREELIAWAGSASKLPREVFLVHGEESALTTLGKAIGRMGPRVQIPAMGDRYLWQQASRQWQRDVQPGKA
jgi:metallo-beta-lactamase family protein